MTPSQKLMIRLKKEVDMAFPRDATIVRIRRGRHGMSAGTWAWEVVTKGDRSLGIGSEDTVKDCLKAKRLSSYSARGDLLICAENS